MKKKKRTRTQYRSAFASFVFLPLPLSLSRPLKRSCTVSLPRHIHVTKIFLVTKREACSSYSIFFLFFRPTLCVSSRCVSACFSTISFVVVVGFMCVHNKDGLSCLFKCFYFLFYLRPLHFFNFSFILINCWNSCSCPSWPQLYNLHFSKKFTKII